MCSSDSTISQLGGGDGGSRMGGSNGDGSRIGAGDGGGKIAVYYADMRGVPEDRAVLPGRSKSPGSAFAVSLLAMAVGREYGIELPVIAADSAGKPYFPDRPDVHFSLSHSRGHILCAVADSMVGADIEAHRKIREPVVLRLMSERERREFDFFELWVLRESFFKLTGTGDLRNLSFCYDDGKLKAPGIGVKCRLYEVPGAAVGLCCYDGELPEHLTIVEPSGLLK